MHAGFYVHIPFCEKRCGYCDFFVVAEKQREIPTYLEALAKEIRLYASNPHIGALPFSTLYFGGGTPSLMHAAHLANLIEHITANFDFVENPEITLETNPGTVDLQTLRAFRSVGVNRLSLGVQSFQAEELRLLDRIHSVQDITNCYEAARRAGFDNISFDLIFALPGQSLRSWESTLETAVRLAPEHISAYNLSFERGTPLTNRLQRGEFQTCPEARQRQMFLHTMDFLGSRGYRQYEISNYAKPGRESRHNTKYWDDSSYLGVGASSHSYVGARRFWNVRNLKKYYQMLDSGRLPVAGEEYLNEEQRCLERVWLGLRQSRGVNFAEFERQTGVSFFEKYFKPLSEFFAFDLDDVELIGDLTVGKRNRRGRMLQIQDGFLRLTEKGILLSDAVCGKFA